ncbi:hypothetical protein [Timonella sp. A28]|uniref:hypothetical protein n=1 Tax=Timonella sp. A28 TaxID=3442640 RepID=UPI003EBE4F66
MTDTPRNEFDRLRDNDPAGEVEFDKEALLENVRSRLPLETPETSPEESHNVSDDENHATPVVVPLKRSSKSLAWAQIAASAAITALLTGGTVYALNQDSSDQQASTESTTIEPALEELETFGPAQPLNELAPQNMVPGSPQSSLKSKSIAPGLSQDAAIDKKIAPWFSSRELFKAQGLSAAPQRAQAFGMDESSVVTEDMMKKLMQVFDVEGDISSEWGSFFAGTGETTTLSLNGGGTGAFWYSTHGKPKSTQQSRDTALSAARQYMTDLGMNADDYSFEYQALEYPVWEPATEKTEDGTTQLPEPTYVKLSEVKATPKLTGSDNDSLQWNFQINGDRAVNVQGYLAKVVNLGEYDVVSAVDGVERLNDPRFGPSNVFMPLERTTEPSPMNDDSDLSTAGPSPAAAPTSGQSFSWHVDVRTITDAQLGNAGFFLDDRTYAVLPVWKFTSDSGSQYEVVAVAESALKF